MMKHRLWRRNLAEKVPFALQTGLGLVFKAPKSEVIKRKTCREAPL